MRIAVNKRGSVFFINPNEVLAVVAQGNYALLVRESDSARLRGSISEIARKLEPCGFVRIHRSVLVNTSWIEEIHSYLPGKYVIHLKGGKQFKISRTYKESLRSMAEIWLGDDTFVGKSHSAAQPEV